MPPRARKGRRAGGSRRETDSTIDHKTMAAWGMPRHKRLADGAARCRGDKPGTMPPQSPHAGIAFVIHSTWEMVLFLARNSSLSTQPSVLARDRLRHIRQLRSVSHHGCMRHGMSQFPQFLMAMSHVQLRTIASSCGGFTGIPCLTKTLSCPQSLSLYQAETGVTSW